MRRHEKQHCELISHFYTGHTQKNGAVLISADKQTAPFFCVCPVFLKEESRLKSEQLKKM